MEKDFKYYLSHPDEMPDDPAFIEKLANEQMESHSEVELEGDKDRSVAADKAGNGENKGASPSAEADDKAETKEEEATEKVEEKPETEKSEAKPDGVLAKDGKNIIPFAVLSNARERAEAAERLVEEQKAELERLKSGAGVTHTDPNHEMLTDSELADLAEDSPTLAKVLRAQQDTIKALSGTVQSIKIKNEREAATQEAEIKSEVQSAIDSNPTLSGWYVDEDRTTWNQAAEFDKVLRASPAYRDVSFEDRFKKVVELTEAALGLNPKQVTPPEKEAGLSTADIKAAAEAKIKEKSKKSMPVSLSQIPGGSEPPADERGRVDQMSSVELGNKLMGMKSQEDILAYMLSL